MISCALPLKLSEGQKTLLMVSRDRSSECAVRQQATTTWTNLDELMHNCRLNFIAHYSSIWSMCVCICIYKISSCSSYLRMSGHALLWQKLDTAWLVLLGHDENTSDVVARIAVAWQALTRWVNVLTFCMTAPRYYMKDCPFTTN